MAKRRGKTLFEQFDSIGEWMEHVRTKRRLKAAFRRDKRASKVKDDEDYDGKLYNGARRSQRRS